MKKSLLLVIITLISFKGISQVLAPDYGSEVFIDLPKIRTQINGSTSAQASIQLPMPNGDVEKLELQNSVLSANQPSDIYTFSGTSEKTKSAIKVAITPSGLSAAIHYNNDFYFIEAIDAKSNRYLMYNMNDVPKGTCGVDDEFTINEVRRQGRIASSSPFPVGSNLRTLRMAAAATHVMTTALGGKTATRDKIVEILNATNLIYEVEASLKFELIPKTITSEDLIFDNSTDDPFVINSSFASASNAQAGFTVLHNDTRLLYSEYDIGHTFNTFTIGGGGSSARGQAGPTPCVDASKSRAWTEFTSNASTGLIVGVFVHEVGHQFRAWHTYNAIGGSVSSPTFCTGGWDSATAIEPGSGSTLMAYGNNCSSPTNYVLTDPNNENYFHTKSLEQIYTSLNTVSACFTPTATGNTPPISNAGADVTIPKGTPFALTGSATDSDASQTLSYAWEQYDIATDYDLNDLLNKPGDKGALGSSTNGLGGYPAVMSTASAPLFRSKILSGPTRTFPDIGFVLTNANNPADNEGEDLPQVGRVMNFRLTVRDNAANGGGVDSDEMVVTVDGNAGPLEVSVFNTAATVAAGSTQTITWNVNNTNTISANVKISLSIDGGNSFPFILAASTANDGSESITLPGNVPSTADARFKVSSLHHPTAEFFDLNNDAVTITSTCLAANNSICPDISFTANEGDASLNLTLAGSFTTPTNGNNLNVDFSGALNRSVIQNDGSGGCSSGFPRSSVVIPFQVTSDGSFNISFSSGFYGMTILNSSTISCSNYVASSITSGSYSSSFDATLSVCTTYYLVVYNAFNLGNTSINISGGASVLKVDSPPAGFSYTYVAENKATGVISSVSATADFTALGAGSYNVYGLSYENGTNVNGFINGTIAQAYGGGSCILFSSNKKDVMIIGSPCPPSLPLVSPNDDITMGVVKLETSGPITATNSITGGNVTYDAGQSIQLNPGFVVNNGVVFSAYIDGCGGQ